MIEPFSVWECVQPTCCAFSSFGLLRAGLRVVELRGFELLTFSLRRLRPVDGRTMDAVAEGSLACMMCPGVDGGSTQGAHVL